MSTSEGDSSSDNTPKRKKGVRNDAKYKNNVRIKSRLLGEKYISQKRIKKTAKKITSGQNKQKENFSISKYSYFMKVKLQGMYWQGSLLRAFACPNFVYQKILLDHRCQIKRHIKEKCPLKLTNLYM